MSDADRVQLVPPGAGIPAIERLVGGALLALRRWRRSGSQLAADLRENHAVVVSNLGIS